MFSTTLFFCCRCCTQRIDGTRRGKVSKRYPYLSIYLSYLSFLSLITAATRQRFPTSPCPRLRQEGGRRRRRERRGRRERRHVPSSFVATGTGMCRCVRSSGERGGLCAGECTQGWMQEYRAVLGCAVCTVQMTALYVSYSSHSVILSYLILSYLINYYHLPHTVYISSGALALAPIDGMVGPAP